MRHEREIVQVVDSAVRPEKKLPPHRSVIVIGMTSLGFFVAVFWVIGRQGLERTFRPQRIGSDWKRSSITGRDSRNLHNYIVFTSAETHLSIRDGHLPGTLARVSGPVFA